MDEAESAALRRHECTGHSLFIESLEALLGRFLGKRKPGPKEPRKPKISMVSRMVLQDGKLNTMVASRMNTETMNRFLAHVARVHAREYIIMVLDGAPSHRGKELVVPENMCLLALPPYSPELNPAELLWDDLREKEFANRVFESLPAATQQLRHGIHRMQHSPDALKSLTGWDSIISSF